MKAQLAIPPLGTKLVLAEDWQFTMHNERRNDPLIKALKVVMPRDDRGFYDRDATMQVILPAGTELIIRRYYIRLGQSAFDSVTFSAKIGKGSHRFWVKLADANNIIAELQPDIVG